MSDNTDSENWAKAKDLFIQASLLPSEEQAAFVAANTLDNPELRSMLEELLYGEDISKSDDKAISKVIGEQAQSILQADTDSQKGDRIAEYEIEDVLGEGGMGIVYLAHRKDAQFEQSVAIKIIQSHALVPQTLERFRQERQILASLQHPNIAQLIGGGETSAGLPYIVMEYIDGLNIIEYCQQHELDVRQRLDLFKQVLKAVSYAHQNLIIHRDLKPSNVLVTQAGDVKLLDFGIAKLIEDKALPEDKNLTAMEVKVLTYANASPEQVRKEKVTTRTDVYGLSALLYQMLSERPLYDITNVTSRELESWIVDKEPTKPSSNLSEDHSARAPNLKSTLSGDLDTIILKGLQKDPDRRYASVDQFAQDIQNYLTNYPIFAKPDSVGYKLQKFYQRNKAFSLVSTVFAVFLVGFSIAVSYQAVVINEAREVAVRQSNNASAVSDFLIATFNAADPAYSGDKQITPLELIDNAALKIDEIKTDNLLKLELTTTIAQVYDSIGAYDKANEFISSAELLTTQVSDVPDAILLTIKAVRLGLNFEFNGPEETKEDGEAFLNELRQKYTVENELRKKDDLADFLINALLTVASIQDLLNEDEVALDLTHEALAIAQNHDSLPTALLGNIYTSLGHTYRRLFKYEKSIAMLEKSREYISTSYGAVNLESARIWNQLASTYNQLDRFEEAVEAAQKGLEMRKTLFPRGHVAIGASLGNLSSIYRANGDKLKALEYRQMSVDEISRALGSDHIYVGATTLGLAQLKLELDRLEEAKEHVLSVLPIFESKLTKDAIDSARPYLLLGKVSYELQDYATALNNLSKSISICQHAKPDGHWLTGETHAYLALVYKALGETQKAIDNKAQAIQIFVDIFGEGSVRHNGMIKLLSAIPSANV